MTIMTTPSLVKNIKPFSPDQSYDFPFVYTSGVQALRNNLIIQELSTGNQVYNATLETFSLKHQVPPSTLSAGSAYRASVRVGGAQDTLSEFSDWVIFWVLEKPELNIINIDYLNQNRVYSQTVDFQTEYTHPNFELLQSYRYNLYDSNQNLMQSYSEIYADGSELLTQEITGLVNGDLYYIELKIYTVNQQEASTGLVLVRPFYIAPILTSAIGVENIKSEGAIKVTANIIQIIGRLYDENGIEIVKDDIEYIDNEKLDMNRPDYDKLVYSEGFDIEGDDFALKLWCENLPEDRVFMKLYSDYGWIDFRCYDNKVHVFKHQYDVTYPSHHTSEEFTVLENEQFMIYVKAVDHSFNIEVTPIN